MRLNAAMKVQVVNKAMDHTFKKRLADHHKECLAIGNAMLKHLMGVNSKAIHKACEAGFTAKAEKVQSDGNFNVVFTVAGQQVALNVDAGSPLPHVRGYSQRVGVIGDPTLVERCRTWQGQVEDTKAAYEKARATLTAMLQNMQTLARLQTDWPEGKKFYQSLPVDFPFQHQVPAVQVKELNKMLGLAA